MEIWRDELYHHGVKGMHWGIRRYQPYSNGKSGLYIGDRNTQIDYGYSSPYKTKNVAPKRSVNPFTRKLTKKSKAYSKEYLRRHRVLEKKRKKRDRKNICRCLINFRKHDRQRFKQDRN